MSKLPRRPPERSYYTVLGVAATADAETIRRAYRRLARECHPDKPTGSKERFAELGVAYAILSDAAERLEYDRRCATGDWPLAAPPRTRTGSFSFTTSSPAAGFAHDHAIFDEMARMFQRNQAQQPSREQQIAHMQRELNRQRQVLVAHRKAMEAAAIKLRQLETDVASTQSAIAALRRLADAEGAFRSGVGVDPETIRRMNVMGGAPPNPRRAG
jgi:curved DNA-binding protein CbpA